MEERLGYEYHTAELSTIAEARRMYATTRDIIEGLDGVFLNKRQTMN